MIFIFFYTLQIGIFEACAVENCVHLKASLTYGRCCRNACKIIHGQEKMFLYEKIWMSDCPNHQKVI